MDLYELLVTPHDLHPVGPREGSFTLGASSYVLCTFRDRSERNNRNQIGICLSVFHPFCRYTSVVIGSRRN